MGAALLQMLAGSGGGVPVNLVPPALDNLVPIVGDLLSPDAGTWTGSPSGFAWLWYRDGVIMGETTEAYTLTTDDIGCRLKRRSIATNAAGDSASVFSDETDAVPSNVTRFTVDAVVKTNGATINLANGVTSVTIAATDGGSLSALSGNTGLATGDNPCTFTVTAEDGAVTLDVTITLHVLTAGVPEMTQVTCEADVAGSKHGTSFAVRKAGDVAVNVKLNGGTRTQILTLDFTGLGGADFVTSADGLSLQAGSAGRQDGIWFNTGTENAPAGATIECSFGPDSTDEQVANQFINAVDANLSSVFTSARSGTLVTLTTIVPGACGASNGVSSGVPITVTQAGRDDASADSGGLVAAIADAMGASAIGDAIAAAANGQGWTVANAAGVVTFTDSAIGPRTDAADVATGFGITVTQQGDDPS